MAAHQRRKTTAPAPATGNVGRKPTVASARTKRKAPPDTTPPVEPVRKLLYTTREAAASLGICEKTLYRHLLSGTLFSLRIGASRRIPIAAIEAYIARQMTDGAI